MSFEGVSSGLECFEQWFIINGKVWQKSIHILGIKRDISTSPLPDRENQNVEILGSEI